MIHLIEKHGARQVAKMLINARVKHVTHGLVTIADLDDRICELVDELEEVLKAELIDDNTIKSILDDINDDYLIENIYA
jgi:Holliday junction resolvasome RuvABC endonuclease subunit